MKWFTSNLLNSQNHNNSFRCPPQPATAQTNITNRSLKVTWFFYSQTCVICTGIWTGICSAVTGLGDALADREPTTTTLFIVDGGASTTSCSPFNRTTHREQTLLQCLNSHYYSRHAELWRLTGKGKLLVIGHLSFDGPPFATKPLRRANAAPATSQNVPINVILILHIQLGYPAHTELRLMIHI